MTLPQSQREYLATVFGGYLAQAKQPTWATLWYHPSKLEADVVRLVAVMDNAKVVKSLSKEQKAIEAAMKGVSETSGMRLFMEIIPTSEFHFRYQAQSGFELIREWNGDNAEVRRPANFWSWIKYKRHGNLLLPILIAGLLLFIVRIFTQQGM